MEPTDFGTKYSSLCPKIYTFDDAIEHLGFGKFQIKLLVIIGFSLVADAAEILVLSILGPALQCIWHIYPTDSTWLTTLVFGGMVIFSPFIGWVCDNFGRKRGIVLSTAFGAYVSILSAFSPSYKWMLALRFLVGSSLAGSIQVFGYLEEFMPMRHRRKAILIQTFCSVGGLWASVFGLLLLYGLPWKVYLLIMSVPMILTTCMTLFLPESVRFLGTIGKLNKAKTILTKIAELNDRSLPPGILVITKHLDKLKDADYLKQMKFKSKDLWEYVLEYRSKFITKYPSKYGSNFTGLTEYGEYSDYADDSRYRITHRNISHKMGSLRLLLIGKRIRTTLMLWYLWFSSGFLYYGIVLLVNPYSQIHNSPQSTQVTHNYSTQGNHNYSTQGNRYYSTQVISEPNSCLSCIPLSSTEYLALIWMAFAEIPGCLATYFFSEIIGRKKTITLKGVLLIMSLVSSFMNVNKVFSILCFIFARASTQGIISALLIYTPEVYPTFLRATGVGFASLFFRIGGMVTPFIAQAVIYNNIYATMGVYVFIAVLLVTSSLYLPVETLNRGLTDTD